MIYRIKCTEQEDSFHQAEAGTSQGSNESGRIGTKSLDLVEKLLRSELHSDSDEEIVFRRIRSSSGIEALLVYINGMADENRINEHVLKPIMRFEGSIGSFKDLSERVVEIGEIKIENNIAAICSAVNGGMAALFSEGEYGCLLLETHGFEKRSIGEAKNESIVFGPKDSFTECLKTNISMVRRLVKTNDLCVKTLDLSTCDNARTAIVYLEGRVMPELIDEITARLCAVKTNTLLTSGVLEQLIEDPSPLPLPRMLSTERPDRAASHLLHGRAVILVDGSPFALAAPITFSSLMNSPEDVYLRPSLGNILRIVRYTGAFISVFLPGYFLALALYHQGMLTTEVLSTVIASRKMVFEPLAVEMILLLLIFQMIREAGLRVPGPIGQAIGIIGGLIMGQAAVSAHLASSVVLIIVAASGLGNFCIPDYSTQLASSYFRIAVVILAWLGGLLGVVCVSMAVLCCMTEMKSFGLPFLSPFAPKKASDRPSILRGRIS